MKRVVRSPTEAYMRKILKDVADDMKEAVVDSHYEKAVASVRADIKEYSLYRTFPFDWNVGIYTNPETISLLDLVNGGAILFILLWRVAMFVVTLQNIFSSSSWCLIYI